MQSISSVHSAIPSQTSVEDKSSEQESFWGKDGFTFGDVIDMINPMHHMPVISKYYREQTEDDASEGSRFIGGVLFGGLIGGVAGLVTSVANAAVRHETHQDVSEQLLAIAEESINEFTSSENELSKTELNGISRSNLNHKELNPFFAQTIDENLLYSSDSHNISVTHTRDWGKV